ncbi:MAG: NADP-dependent malic enzyme [Hydrogenophilus sp.]|nr:NADP-dependent malic enzyme [Hydrogenophilus sp.]
MTTFTPDEERRRAALDYHQNPTPGKWAILPTKALSNQRDLALAYSPGVAAPAEAIAADPAVVARYTNRANLVAVITNGTAVLGLGNIGPLAAKPVMEGKAVLFKKFAAIDAIDLEIAEQDPARLVDIIAALEPSFGGINLEDIKAPDCFWIEEQLRRRLKIPVLHDDQHGTAVVVAAALLNALEWVGKSITSVKLVTAGAGAAALACLDLLVKLGLPKSNIWVTDLAGVVYTGRTQLMDPYKARYAQETDARTLADIIGDADIFLGLSAGGVLKPELLRAMAARPIIFALANPTPEIDPDLARQLRPDAIIATGRSDFPNQVNNVLCFPYLFRGALDVGATAITDEMLIAAVHAIARLARIEEHEQVAAAYGGETLRFGPDYLIPKPFDPRLMLTIAPAVVEAAMRSGVATRPIADLDAYRERLQAFVYASGTLMKPVYAIAKRARFKKIAFAEGEEERVLRAAQVLVDEGIARPILIGRPAVIAERIEQYGLRLTPERDYEIVPIESDARILSYWQEYHQIMERRGVTPQLAQIEMRRRHTLLGAMLLRHWEVHGLICGTWGVPTMHLSYIDQVIGKRPGATCYAAMNALLLPNRQLFLVDTHINLDPTAEQIAEITRMAARKMLRFGVTPKAALLSHSNFGSSDAPSACKMRRALAILRETAPWLEVDGEMHGDIALDAAMRAQIMPRSTLSGEANLLVLPNIDAANIAYNLLKTAAGGGIAIGPMLLGVAKPVHILTATSTVRRIVNMAALTVAEANLGPRAVEPTPPIAEPITA